MKLKLTMLTTAIFSVFLMSFGIEELKDPMQLDNSLYRFIENKGQWDAEIMYKLETSMASINLEKDRLFFQLIDPSTMHGHKTGSDQGHEAHEHHDHDHAQVAESSSSLVRGHNFSMNFVGSSKYVSTSSARPLDYYHNYFIGNDQSRWASKVSVYNEVQYNEIYDGIDLRFYEQGGHLKYDYIVQPGYSADQIQIRYDDVDKLSIQDGDLHIETSVGTIVEKAPFAFQQIERNQSIVECQFVLRGNVLSIKVLDEYNKQYPLIIDPELVFGSYTGAFADNWGFTATFDDKGHAYGGGIAFGTYPTTPGAFQISNGGGSTDMSISKFSPDGTSLIYSTFLGGASSDAPESMIVNAKGQLVVMGVTGSIDFPLTDDAADRIFNGGNPTSFSLLDFSNGADIVVAILSADGTALMGGSFVGGSGTDGFNDLGATTRDNYGDDFRGEVEVDSEDNIIVISSSDSDDFPVTTGAFDTEGSGAFDQDAVLFKLNGDASELIWATYLGDAGQQAGISIAIDKDDNIYATGRTAGNNFPTTSGTLHSTYQGGGTDGFVAHITADGSTVVAGSFIGTNADDASYLVELDKDGNVYLFGQDNTGGYPITGDVYSNPGSANFIQKLDPALSTSLWSTQVGNGSTVRMVPTAFLVDNCNRIYVAAWGGITNGDFGGMRDMPLTSDAFQSSTDGSDFYLMVLEPDATGLEYGSYFGGGQSAEHVDGGTSRFDKKGVVYQAVCAGCGGNSDFPTTDGAVSNTNNANNCNLGLFKFDFQLAALNVDFDISEPVVCVGEEVIFTNLTTAADDFFWDFGDGTTSDEVSPSHSYENPGIYEVSLLATSDEGCLPADSITKIVEVLDIGCGTLTAGEDIVADPSNPTVTLDAAFMGCGEFTWFGGDGTFAPDRDDPIADYTLSDDEIAAGEAFLFAVLTSGTTACFDTVKITIFQETGDLVTWDLDACKASPGATMDYSEFEATLGEGIDCGSVEASIVYRENPSANKHSCTPGVNDSPAMCVGSQDACEYIAGAETAVRFDVTLDPTGDQPMRIAGLSFYEQAPDEFDWINGANGPNDFPTLYAVRILKDGVVIYEETEIPTTMEWTLESFDFEGDDNFETRELSTYSFELSPYCTSGDPEIPINAWDLDEISVDIRCGFGGLQEEETEDRAVAQIKSGAHLFPNSPSPFQDQSYFSFRFDQETDASFRVMTIDGEPLYQLDQRFAAGQHVLRLGGDDLKQYKGMIIYQIVGEGFSLSAKSIVLD